MEIKQLLDSQNSREFLKQALWLNHQKNGKINISDFSRKCGFSSRSYVSEFLTGKKGLSHDSFRRIKNSLKLPKNYLKYFEYLVYKDFSNLCPSTLTQSQILKKLNEFKEDLHKENPIGDTNLLDWITQPLTFQIYAALGSIEKGASVPEIQFRTKLSEKWILEILSSLLNHQLITSRDNRYFVITENLDFFNPKQTEKMKILIENVCNEIKKNIAKTWSDSNNTLFYTSFSTNKVKLKSFKQELNDLIFQLIDKYQYDDGDTIQQIFFCQKGP